MTVRMEKARKTRNRFPSPSHRALGNRCSDSHIPTAPVAVSLFSKPKRKEPLATDLHLFRSGSFFDEKMLMVPARDNRGGPGEDSVVAAS